MKKIFTGVLGLVSITGVLAQNLTGVIKGRITTKDGQPAAWVNTGIKVLNKLTTTNASGEFLLNGLSTGDYELVISFVGLMPQQKKVHVSERDTVEINFVLEESANQLQEVVVRATRNQNEKPVTLGKVAISPMDLPQSVTVIEKNVLDRQQTLRLSDAIMNVNGVYVMGTTGGGQEEFAARGYAFNSSNTFKNGARYNNGAMPEMTGVEKVEILKGSAAILYGNVAAGGVLNLVTKKPQFERGGEISMRLGSYNFYKPSLDIYGSLNRKKTVAFRLNTSYENAASFRDVVKAERFYINPSLLVKAGKRTDVLLEGDYLTDNRTSDFGVGAINYQLINIPRSRFLGTSWAYYKTNQKTGTTTVTHHFNDNWQLKNTSSYQQFSGETFGTSRPNSGTFIQPNGVWARGLQRSRNEENYYVSQIDLTGKFKTGNVRHQLLIGADVDRYESKATAYTYANAAIDNKNIYDTINVFDLSTYKQREDIPTITAVTLTYTPTTRLGLYVQDLVSLTNKLKVLAGVRYTFQEARNGYVDSLQKNKRVAVAGTSDKAFSPRVGIVYQPTTNVSLFTSYANSFTLNTGTDVFLQPLAPSFINQYEVGVKTELFKKVLSANLTAYKIINSNLAQVSILDANGQANNNTNIKELAGEVTSNGIELDLITKSINGFSFIGGYSFNDTKYTKSNTYVTGSKLRYNPQHTANASLHYAFNQTSPLKGFNIGFIAYYVGERVAGRSTRIQVTGDTYRLMPIPAYTQFDASIGYGREHVSIRVKVSNLLNKLSYNVHDDNSVNPIAPRQLAATVAFKL